MKSDVCPIDGKASNLSEILRQVEKTAAYNELEEKPALQLRLLAEELVGMLPELLYCASGEFWIESSGGKNFELHASLRADKNDLDFNEKVLSISKSGRNEAARGLMGKISATVLDMLHVYTSPIVQSNIDYSAMGMSTAPGYSNFWTLAAYRDKAEQYNNDGQTDAWDELEKSIVANIADDVLVGIKGEKVDIIIKKRFD